MIRKIDYFYTSIKDESGEGYRFLAQLAAKKVDLTAFTAVPFGPDRAQLTLFPTDTASLSAAAKQEKIDLDGPHSAILVQGQDQIGVLAGILSKLAAVSINVFSVHCLTDGRGGFGTIIYLRPSDIDQALKTLGSS